MRQSAGFSQTNGGKEDVYNTKEKENGEKKPVLEVKTLGLLEFHFNNREISLGSCLTGKVKELFLILAWAGMDGIGRVKLQDFLYDRSTVNAANGLRILSCRLRKELRQSELPEGTYVQNRKNMYYLGGDMEIRMDAVWMERLYREAMSEKEKKKQVLLLEQACRLYRGEFLPSFSGEFWVEWMRSHYQEIYFSCLREVCRLLKQSEQYERALKLLEEAVRLYPFMEEWIGWKLEMLAGMHRYKEMKRVYHEAVTHVLEEAEQSVSTQLIERFRELSSHACYTSGEISDICESLVADGIKELPYCCSFPGFVDCFRSRLRAGLHNTPGASLMICLISERNSRKIKDMARLKSYVDCLCEILDETLRREDIYTRSQPGQVLILTGCSPDKRGGHLEKEIRDGFRQKCGGKAMVSVWSRGAETLIKK